MLKNVAFCLIYALPPDKQFFSHSDRLELQGKILNIVCVRGGGAGNIFWETREQATSGMASLLHSRSVLESLWLQTDQEPQTN